MNTTIKNTLYNIIKSSNKFINKDLQYHIKYILIILILIFLLKLIINKKLEAFRISLELPKNDSKHPRNVLITLKPEFNKSGNSSSILEVSLGDVNTSTLKFFDGASATALTKSYHRPNKAMNIMGIEKQTTIGSISSIDSYTLKNPTETIFRNIKNIPNFTIEVYSDTAHNVGKSPADIRIRWNKDYYNGISSGSGGGAGAGIEKYNDLYLKILKKNIYLFLIKFSDGAGPKIPTTPTTPTTTSLPKSINITGTNPPITLEDIDSWNETSGKLTFVYELVKLLGTQLDKTKKEMFDDATNIIKNPLLNAIGWYQFQQPTGKDPYINLNRFLSRKADIPVKTHKIDQTNKITIKYYS